YPTLCASISLSFQCSRAHRDLHSFPTRRSSDLDDGDLCRRVANPVEHARGLVRRFSGEHEIADRNRVDRRDQHRARGDVLGKLRSEEHTSELQSQSNLVCRLLLEKKKKQQEEDI